MLVKMKIETKDLWQSAYLLAKGSILEEIKLYANGRYRPEATFIIDGENTRIYLQEYRSGQAECKVSMLKASMEHLKEEMFRLIRRF